jgi:hypothetical protein
VLAGVSTQIGVAAGDDFDGDGLGDLVLVDRSQRTLSALLLGPSAVSPPPSDFSSASVSADLAREIGDSDNDWQPDFCDADLDNDGLVGIIDIHIALACLGPISAEGCAALDTDRDGTIARSELDSITSRYGEPACAELTALAVDAISDPRRSGGKNSR